MIRRDTIHNDAPEWLLIPQGEHARLSAEIAEHWAAPHGSELPLPELLLPAIRDHDFGWTEWEHAPAVDPQTGKPRNFTEMPMSDATAIWTRSIDECARHHPLGAICVSRHFCYLGDMARSTREQPDDIAAITAFLDAQQTSQHAWTRAAGTSFADPEELQRVLDRGFHWVQFFDALSLWLCMAERSEPVELTTPDQSRLRLIPQSPTEIVLEPHSLSVPALDLAVDARRIPAIPYPTDAQLLATIRTAPIETLTWQLRSA